MVVDICNCQVEYAQVYLIIIHDSINQMVLSQLSDKVNLICLKEKPPTKIPFFVFGLWLRLFKLRPDILHLHNRMSLKLFPHFTKRFIKTIQFTFHTTGIAPGRDVLRVDSCFSISNAVRNELIGRTGIDSTVIYNGIAVGSIPCRNVRNAPEKTFKIVQVGRVDFSIKGQDILLKAVAQCIKKSSHQEVTVDFFGDGKDLDALQSLAHELNISEKVTCHGGVKKSQIYSKLNGYDLYVQPSRIEGFGLTIAEAMAAKVPVAVSNIEGPMEVVDGGKYGFVFETDNVDACADAIALCIENYNNGNIQETVERAYERVSTLFNIEETSKRYAEIGE